MVLALALGTLFLMSIISLMPKSSAQEAKHHTLKFTGPNKNDLLNLLEEKTCLDLEFGHDGETVTIIGTKDDCKPNSQSLADLIKKIATGDKTVEVEAGRSQDYTVIDAFRGDGKGAVDLDDIEKFPQTPPEGTPWANTSWSFLQCGMDASNSWSNSSWNSRLCVTKENKIESGARRAVKTSSPRRQKLGSRL